MAQVTWLGVAGDDTQDIEQDGFTFVKGEPVEVPDNHPRLYRYIRNQAFKVEGAEGVVTEPPAVATIQPSVEVLMADRAAQSRAAIQAEADRRAAEQPDEVIEGDDETELAAIRGELDQRGIKYSQRAGVASLRQKLAEAEG